MPPNVINVTNDYSLTSENIATKKEVCDKDLLALVSYGDETRKELSYFRRELITFTVAVTGLFRANFANLKQLLECMLTKTNIVDLGTFFG